MKACYTFLSYPESSDCKEIECELLSLGWAFYRSPLHDKDVEDDGTPKKAHYHWYVGFPKNPPDYALIKATVNAVGAVIPPARKAIINDPEAAEDYGAHKNNPEKAQYSADDAVISDNWYAPDYSSQSQKRSKKATQSAGEQAQALQILREMQFCEFSAFVEYIADNKANLLGTVFQNAYTFKAFIDSRRYSRTLAEQEKTDKLRAEIEQLQALHDETIRELQDWKARYLALYENITGETALKDYEI